MYFHGLLKVLLLMVETTIANGSITNIHTYGATKTS